MDFSTVALICSLYLISCGTVPRKVRESFLVRYNFDSSDRSTEVYHIEYSTFSRSTIRGKELYDTFKNSYDFVLYSDFTFLDNFSYKSLNGKMYVFGDWGIWEQRSDTIIAQYMNDARDKFNKTFYVREERFIVDNNKINFFIGSRNILHNQPQGEYGIVQGTVIIYPVKLDSIPPPNSWLKTQEWIYKQQKP